MKRRVKQKQKIGSTVRIRLPTDYQVTDYIPGFGTDTEVRKWCIEKALSYKEKRYGQFLTVLEKANELYQWVKK